MAQKKTTRLHFSEEDLTDPKVRKAASRADAAADKADKAKQRLPTQRKLRWEREGAENTLRQEREPVKSDASEIDPAKQKSQRKQVRREADAQKKSAAEKAKTGAKQAQRQRDTRTAGPDQPKRPGSKLKSETEQMQKQRRKLIFDEVEAEKPSAAARKLTHTPAAVASAEVHRAVSRGNEDDNTGVQAAHFGESAAEGTVHAADHVSYSRKLRKYRRAEKLEAKADAANIEALYQKSLADNPEAASNPISRWRQKQAIKKEYAAMKASQSAAQTGSTASGTASGAKKAGQGVKDIANRIVDYAKSHSHILLLILALGLLVMVIAGSISSCTAMLGGSGNVVIGTSFTAEDEDILGAEAYYCAMEDDLRRQIEELEDDDDYDEVRLSVDEIGHDPWKLAALLTVLYEDYTEEEVRGFLRQVFDAQYDLSSSTSTETVTETKTVRVGESLGTVTTSGYCNCVICCGIWSGGPTASGVYPTANHTLAVDANNPFVPIGTKVVMNGVEYTVEDTGNFARYGVQFDVYYDNHIAASLHGHKQWECYLADDNGSNTVDVTTTETKRILTVTATNHSLESVIANLGLTDDEMERYQVLLETKGNRSYLFEDYAYSSTGEYTDYDIPGEALTDEKFRKMITEAEKYLGYPYVWGGSSPSTSFDCSGFVSYVINNCGNGWNYGRLTADGLKNICSIIPKSEAKPGDLIFFQGTYNTSGASHVGIYVGNGMMIHCGNPISYASIETSYWQQHFYCFGRLP